MTERERWSSGRERERERGRVRVAGGVRESRWRAVLAVGREQHGLLTVGQAVAAGIPRSTFVGRVQREGWERPYTNVVVLPGTRMDGALSARAAALAIGEHAIVTGESSLHLHGVADVAPVRPHVVVPYPSRAQLTGVRVTRSRTLHPADHVFDTGVAIATPERALLDAAARTGLPRLRQWLIDGRQRRRLEVARVARRAALAVSAPGRGRLLRACREVDGSGADSALVAEVEGRLLAAGFDLDVPPQVVATPGRVLHPDLTVCQVPVGVEVDGYGTHSSRHALDHDQRKHNAYVLAGWTILRVSWSRLQDDWQGFVTELRAAVAAGDHAPRCAPW